MDWKEFASKLKAKYPDYSDMNDEDLVRKMMTKFPQYSDIDTSGMSQAPAQPAVTQPQAPQVAAQPVDNTVSLSNPQSIVNSLTKQGINTDAKYLDPQNMTALFPRSSYNQATGNTNGWQNFAAGVGDLASLGGRTLMSGLQSLDAARYGTANDYSQSVLRQMPYLDADVSPEAGESGFNLPGIGSYITNTIVRDPLAPLLGGASNATRITSLNPSKWTTMTTNGLGSLYNAVSNIPTMVNDLGQSYPLITNALKAAGGAGIGAGQGTLESLMNDYGTGQGMDWVKPIFSGAVGGLIPGFSNAVDKASTYLQSKASNIADFLKTPFEPSTWGNVDVKGQPISNQQIANLVEGKKAIDNSSTVNTKYLSQIYSDIIKSRGITGSGSTLGNILMDTKGAVGDIGDYLQELSQYNNLRQGLTSGSLQDINNWMVNNTDIPGNIQAAAEAVHKLAPLKTMGLSDLAHGAINTAQNINNAIPGPVKNVVKKYANDMVKNPENYVQPSQHGGYQVGPAWNPTNPESPVTLSDFFNIGQQ